jgi:hypothetical protein
MAGLFDPLTQSQFLGKVFLLLAQSTTAGASLVRSLICRFHDVTVAFINITETKGMTTEQS